MNAAWTCLSVHLGSCSVQKCSIKAKMALFRANSSNKPNPKNFSWAIANEHASPVAPMRLEEVLFGRYNLCLPNDSDLYKSQKNRSK